MKIICISDTHLRKFDLPEGDFLIHAGDALSYGSLQELKLFGEHQLKPWRERFGANILFVPGNHDRVLELPLGQRILAEEYGIRCLIDEAAEVQYGPSDARKTLKIYGSPWQPRFFDWAFNLDRNSPALKAKWDLIPSDLDVLITHGPPHGILDRTDRGVNAGCELLRVAVERVKPRYHIFGHIHRAYGLERVGETTFINAAVCGENYRPVNKPLVFEV